MNADINVADAVSVTAENDIAAIAVTEDGAVWAKSVTYGLCEGTIERTVEL